MMKTGWWQVKFDLTLDGEDVRWDDLDEATQEHIAECIKDGYCGGEIVIEDYDADEADCMIYTSQDGEQIIFDDYTDETEEHHTYWVGMCEHCYGKYKSILGSRVDNCGSGVCSVNGCFNKADYYVDFDMNEVTFS
jgi:hypothetical protein